MRGDNLLTCRAGPPGAREAPHELAADPLAPLMAQILDELREIRATLAGASKPFYTIDEVAELTGRTPYTVRRWVAEGRIAATRVSGTGPRGRLLVARDQLQRLVGLGPRRRGAPGRRRLSRSSRFLAAGQVRVIWAA